MAEPGFTLNLKEIVIIAMAVFNLVIWGPIGWNVRRLVNDYDKHKDSNNKTISDLQDEIDDLRQRYNDLRASLPEKYVSLPRFVDEMKTVKDMFQQILEKLDNKADK